MSFDWTRTYTSTDAAVGPLGPGWTHTYAASLQLQANGDVLARGEEGQEILFTRQADGSFAGAPGARATLSPVAGGYELLRRDQVTYAFGASGRLLAIEDRNGEGVALAYDAQARLATVTDPAGRRATVAYDASGRVGSVSTDDGRSVSYGYVSGRLASVTDVGGKTWRYTYDAGGRLATIVDPLGHTLVTSAYGADGTRAVADGRGREDDAVLLGSGDGDCRGHRCERRRLEARLRRGHARAGDRPAGRGYRLDHDVDLNTVAVTSPSAERSTMIYDAAGNLLAATAPASLGNAQKRFAYNTRNDPTQVTDARGTVTSYTYTPHGNTETVRQDGVLVASYSYDAGGRVLTATDGNGRTTAYTYAPASGYLASVTDPLGNETTYTYDGAGRVATRVDPEGEHLAFQSRGLPLVVHIRRSGAAADRDRPARPCDDRRLRRRRQARLDDRRERPRDLVPLLRRRPGRDGDLPGPRRRRPARRARHEVCVRRCRQQGRADRSSGFDDELRLRRGESPDLRDRCGPGRIRPSRRSRHDARLRREREPRLDGRAARQRPRRRPGRLPHDLRLRRRRQASADDRPARQLHREHVRRGREPLLDPRRERPRYELHARRIRSGAHRHRTRPGRHRLCRTTPPATSSPGATRTATRRRTATTTRASSSRRRAPTPMAPALERPR